MESGGSSHTTGNKTGSRQAWTKEEEEKIFNILDALVANGSQADNGTFKSGSYKYIKNELEKLQPDCGLKAYPHIDSKIRIWKKNYGMLFDILNTSGFGWNDVRKCMEVDSDEAWKSYVESHKETTNWRNKLFPYYERLANIFGKDRATRRSAETPIDMANATLQEEIHDDNEIDDEGFPMFVSLSVNSQDTTRSRAQSSHRKRSKSDEYVVDGFEKLVSAFH